MKQFSIFSWFGYSIPMAERFRLIKAAGFDGVMLWWSDEHIEVDGAKELQPDLARRYGLAIENIHTPFEVINFLWEDSAAGDDIEKTLAKCIADCSKYEIPTAVIHVSRGNTPPPPNQIGLDRFKRLVDLAEKENINIALENLRKPEYLDFIFDRIQSDRLGFCYDSGHENSFTKGTDFLRRYGSKLMALHLHDNDGSDDQHRLIGEGSIDWENLRKKLQDTEYTGSIALEVVGQSSGETPEQFLARAYQSSRWFV